jgi:hypothetical protein
VSFGILGSSFFMQVIIVKALGNAPWASKDVLLAACALSPALTAYRAVFGERPRPGAQLSIALLGSLRGVEVIFETFPELILQLTLLLSALDGCTRRTISFIMRGWLIVKHRIG